ncbi:zinc finger matrin-type protein 5 [Oratosquilla oratoria]|uniref:zinc finger matrin-type protein 5 n=1 Tax=Oratosquilla oratoria TaxID=337810 RepID=UPI003F75B000
MGKRYYCDYCDRSFPYSIEARKKHISGHQHLKVRKQHYYHFKTAQNRLGEETQKKKCKFFHSGRECSFGDNCCFSHMTQLDLDLLKDEADKEKFAEDLSNLPPQIQNGEEPSLEMWLLSSWKRKGNETPKMKKLTLKLKLESGLCEALSDRHIDEVPPSLRSFGVDDVAQTAFEKWGL